MNQEAPLRAPIVFLRRLSESGTLQLDRERSAGDLGVRHRLWGNQRIHLLPQAGRLEASESGIELELTLRSAHAPDRRLPTPAAAGTGVATLYFVTGDRIASIDANVCRLAGDLRIEGVVGPAVLEIRDLGWTGKGGWLRHTLTAGATLEREFWRWAVTARQTGWMLEHMARLFLHTEWLAGPDTTRVA